MNLLFCVAFTWTLHTEPKKRQQGFAQLRAPTTQLGGRPRPLARTRACPGSLAGGSGATEATVAMELAEDWLVESLRL